MTAAPTISEHDLVERTVSMLLLFGTTSGHLVQRVYHAHRGSCLPPRSGCTNACQEWGALLDAWTTRLMDLNVQNAPPVQLELEVPWP